LGATANNSLVSTADAKRNRLRLRGGISDGRSRLVLALALRRRM